MLDKWRKQRSQAVEFVPLDIRTQQCGEFGSEFHEQIALCDVFHRCRGIYPEFSRKIGLALLPAKVGQRGFPARDGIGTPAFFPKNQCGVILHIAEVGAELESMPIIGKRASCFIPAGVEVA